MKMKPSEKYLKLMSVARGCAIICGADVNDPNYRFNGLTALVSVAIFMYFILTIYTTKLLFMGSWGVILQSFCMVGCILQGVSKLISGLVYTKDLSSTNIFIIKMYTKYEQKCEKYVQVLDRTASFVTFLVQVIGGIYVILFSWLILSPVVLLMVSGRRYLPMQFKLPGLDEDTDFGYFATIAMQSSFLAIAGFGNFAGDLNILIFNTQIKMFIDILNLKVFSLNEIARNCVETEVTKSILNDIIDWHQKYSSFTILCKTMMYWIIFTQVSSSALSMVFTMIIIMTGDWPGAYAFMVLQIFALFTYCGMGTMVEIASDKFCEEIYSINWYELSVSQRKCIIMMLMKSQDPILLSVGGVMPLSVSTGLTVIKSVYSIMMMILQFVE